MYFYGLTIPPKKSNLRHISVLTKLLMAVIQNQSHLLSLLQDFRTRVDASCRYSEEFTNIYYDCMDKKRRVGTEPYWLHRYKHLPWCPYFGKHFFVGSLKKKKICR